MSEILVSDDVIIDSVLGRIETIILWDEENSRFRITAKYRDILILPAMPAKTSPGILRYNNTEND